MKIKGAGTVRRSGKNSWQIVFNLGCDPLTGKYKQVTRTVTGSKAKAYKEREAFRNEIESGIKLDADKVTFGEYSKQWYDYRTTCGRYAVSTLQKDKYLLAHLNKHLAGVTLKDIDPATVKSLYLNLRNVDKRGATQIADASVLLHKLFEDAITDGILMINPCSRVERPRRPKQTDRRSLDKEQTARLIAALDSTAETATDSDQYSLILLLSRMMVVRLALATGMRRGELLGLRWMDIELGERATVSVRHTLQRDKTLKDPKSASSIRTIALDDVTASKLAEWKVMQAEYLLGFGMAQKGSTPVITDSIGGFMNPDNYKHWHDSFMESNGFAGLRLHELRHTHATLLISSGVNIKTASDRLGHASTGLTLDLYAHALREDDEKAAAIIGGLLAEKPPEMGKVISL